MELLWAHLKDYLLAFILPRKLYMTNAMAVQYTVNARTKSGGGGSGSSNKGDKGPIRTILTGNKIMDMVFFHTMGDPTPGKGSSLMGKSRTSGPKIELEMN